MCSASEPINAAINLVHCLMHNPFQVLSRALDTFQSCLDIYCIGFFHCQDYIVFHILMEKYSTDLNQVLNLSPPFFQVIPCFDVRGPQILIHLFIEALLLYAKLP
jgi:hypothetical protein